MTLEQATIVVRSGLNKDEQYGCVVPPIVLSSTYNFSDFNKPRVYDYSRRRNPTRDVAQKALSELEGGAGAVITSSGMSAIYLLCITFLEPGDLLVAPHDCYGGSYRLLSNLNRRGLYRVKFVNQGDMQELSYVLLSLNPKLVFIETPSNPLLRVVDIAAICNLIKTGNRTNTMYVVDNTFMSPILQNPLILGADLVVHSCTKYLNGHSDLVAGAIVAKNIDIISELAWWSNVIGVAGSAFDSYQLLRGMRTLVPRISQQQRNAYNIIKFLKQQSKIKALYYPGLKNNIGYNIACRQQKGFGAILSFELEGSERELRAFLSSLKLFTLAESFGGVESLISHPATMTHAGMSEKARDCAGISDMLLRISVGIEDSKDLIDDLKQALQAI